VGASVNAIDDISHDRQAATAQGAKHLPLETNVGAADARNAGLREVRSPFVGSVVVVAPDVLSTCCSI
jgi:glycosyltransferase involved in cell wall biosynthesis